MIINIKDRIRVKRELLSLPRIDSIVSEPVNTEPYRLHQNVVRLAVKPKLRLVPVST